MDSSTLVSPQQLQSPEKGSVNGIISLVGIMDVAEPHAIYLAGKLPT